MKTKSSFMLLYSLNLFPTFAYASFPEKYYSGTKHFWETWSKKRNCSKRILYFNRKKSRGKTEAQVFKMHQMKKEEKTEESRLVGSLLKITKVHLC